ncbi:MAG: hypothetical protein Q8K07_17200 [Methylicorpusculum sp.]|uniref:helix-turn-helix domain-containing protein n=1 Tax=Methylicorpusculum sp. TaxID=2713644 RepID=UPI002731C14C|nr:hypothetical protein [Methylicorpusculum sp.]MDP2203760.1 hypothetical protein [Methylicorpusculum sp.]
MRTWADELKVHTHRYLRRGGKQNRKKQVALIIDFLKYTDAQEGLTALHRLGQRQVISFWKGHRELSAKSAYDYWLGLCKLWEWLKKPDKPPKPNTFADYHGPVQRKDKDSEAKPGSVRLAEAVHQARVRKHLSLQQLANLSGCEVKDIEALEAGHDTSPLGRTQRLLDLLNISLIIGND